MSFITRSLPPEADDPPPAPPTELESLAAERLALLARVRRGRTRGHHDGAEETQRDVAH